MIYEKVSHIVLEDFYIFTTSSDNQEISHIYLASIKMFVLFCFFLPLLLLKHCAKYVCIERHYLLIPAPDDRQSVRGSRLNVCVTLHVRRVVLLKNQAFQR